jgi:hypothetical protein
MMFDRAMNRAMNWRALVTAFAMVWIPVVVGCRAGGSCSDGSCSSGSCSDGSCSRPAEPIWGTAPSDSSPNIYPSQSAPSGATNYSSGSGTR